MAPAQDQDELPVVKDGIVFADDLKQAARSMKNEYTGIDGFDRTNKLMFFGVEDWKAADLREMTESFEESTFKKMEFFGCELGKGGTKAIAEGLKKKGGKEKLTDIDLDHSPLDASESQHFFKAINDANVSNLNLQGSLKEKTAFDHMMKELASNTKIISIDLKINALKGEWMAPMEAFLMQNQTVKEIDLFYNELKLDGMKHIFRALSLDQCRLEKLNLSCNDIQDAGCAALASGLATNTHLKELDISLNSIGDEGAAVLLAVLGGDDIFSEGEEGFTRRIPAYEENMQQYYINTAKKHERPPLQSLDISANNLGDAALDRIGNLAANNRDVMKKLDFTGCEGGEGGWKSLAAGFGRNVANTQDTCHFHFSIVDIPENVLALVEKEIAGHLNRFHYKREVPANQATN